MPPASTPGSQVEDDGIRPTKRRRINSHLTRGPTACEKCRQRKTKCDNARPRCGFCAKQDAACVYVEDVVPAPWEEMGDRILDAIDQLATVVKEDHKRWPHRFSQSQNSLPGSNSQHEIQSPAHLSLRLDGQSPVSVQRQSRAATDVNELTPLNPQGTDTVLSWPIFKELHSSDCLYAEEEAVEVIHTAIPNMSLQNLHDLTTKYIDGVHVKNPILDIVELNRMTREVAENGVSWSAESCLVTLVCAIGAISESNYHPQTETARRRLSQSSPSVFESDLQIQLSMQFWNVAAKRMGIVMARSDIISIQCLCLAGIFYMHQLQPMAAWKFFNLAGASWYVLQTASKKNSTASPFISHPDSFTVMQSLFFTIWKSECELRVELDVPGPVLKSVDFPHAFPSPPMQDITSPSHEMEQHEQIWYYYLAEIAARHLQNQVLRATAGFAVIATNQNVQSLLTRAELLETLLQEWYDSLPQAIRFVVPSGFTAIQPASDFCQILLHRYLNSRDLVTRPFLKLCIETDLDIDRHLRSRVIALASENVRISLLKATEDLGFLHQGTWYGLRNVTTAALILSAVSLSKTTAIAPYSQQILLPTDWKERIGRAVDALMPFWRTRRGGAARLYGVIQQALDMSTE